MLAKKNDANPFQHRNVPKEMLGSWTRGRQGAEQDVLQYKSKDSLVKVMPPARERWIGCG